MINRQAVIHRPLSQFAYAPSEYCLTIRIQVAKDDLQKCTLYYGDRVDPHAQVCFRAQLMEKVASDVCFDYYEITIASEFNRVCYYFCLEAETEKLFLYSDVLASDLPNERSEFYQYPFIRREEICAVPAWWKEAIVYNIFPDSFANGKRTIVEHAETMFDKASDQLLHTRIGGTIRGIIENLDYISDIGFNCLYLNPIFTAGEYHRYDLLDYYHISPNLGTDEEFRQLVKSAHARGMHVIIDGVFNHCSWYFFAFADVVKNGENSRYKDWFYDLQFPVERPSAGEKPTYSCFAYEAKMPKLNSSNPEVRAYFLDVCRYWLQDFDVDGWRLDVANEVDKEFWREFRRVAKQTKEECVLIAEIWENAERWLQGDMFDSAMNYDFRKNCRDFFANSKLSASEFNSRLIRMNWRYPFPLVQGQLNLLDSHDVSRFKSLCECKERFALAVIFLFTSVGVPSVFYGDELGMLGTSEYELRAAMPWKNIPDDQRELFRNLIKLRKNNVCLREGTLRVLDYDEQGKFVFAREFQKQSVIVACNVSEYSNANFKNLPLAKAFLESGYSSSDNKMAAFGYAVWAV